MQEQEFQHNLVIMLPIQIHQHGPIGLMLHLMHNLEIMMSIRIPSHHHHQEPITIRIVTVKELATICMEGTLAQEEVSGMEHLM